VKISDIIRQYEGGRAVKEVVKQLSTQRAIKLTGHKGSLASVVAVAVNRMLPGISIHILNDKESAAYFMNDLEQLLGETDYELSRKKVLMLPASRKHRYDGGPSDNDNILLRTEVLKRFSGGTKNLMVVTFPEALAEKVVTKSTLNKSIIRLKEGEEVDVEFIFELLTEYGFEQEDFVLEPGQFAIRGGIVDVFSFSNDMPYRIEFFGDKVESIRTFDPSSQRSVKRLSRIQILPDIQNSQTVEKRINFLDFIPENSVIWLTDSKFASDRIDNEIKKTREAFENIEGEIKQLLPEEINITGSEFTASLTKHKTVFTGNQAVDTNAEVVFNAGPQPLFHKNFELLIQNLEDNAAAGITNFILSENPKQLERIKSIFEDIAARKNENPIGFTPVNISLHEGYIDHEERIALYTDHQIFERYHRFRIKERFGSKESLKLRELYDLQPGDYVTHVDHGIGRFGGLEKIMNNGREQEAIRLHYKNGDLLYVSIHSLHRISKYSGKDGAEPKLNTLGSKAWKSLKKKTKSRVKDIARELIALYAKRKAAGGYAFEPDTFMQTELESSFIYEDTPDQLKATQEVKRDMESPEPMDRLICGDVGFGKTEIAIRAAFKAVADSKQVAILVPTTILALQHYKTFSERLKDFPVEVEYLNRFKSTAQKNEILKKLKQGRIDILIGTHRIISKDVEFKDLGLLIIDEEQKFGVAVKEKLKNLRVNIDTLTLTATPIPRTLQFSLMGARDLSIIATPPPNRFPVQTELHTINDKLIRDAINYEISRRGQVYIINNRIQNIYKVAEMVKRLVPKAAVAVGHGQMKGNELESIMLGFINGDYDVLVSTTIIESGLDIPNANTMIIYDAQNFGLSDLHQLRGRVGRSNKKAFCYLLSPPPAALSREARKRLEAIVEYSALGSGINIAMRDLDIRGAGNILGGEQSGFISDIGFEMYHQILDEAIQELKENEFKDLFKKELDEKKKQWTKTTKIETDLELLIPDDYVLQNSERLSLYKQLDSLKTEEELADYRKMLEDRFGPVPPEVNELLETIRLRWAATTLGFEKLVIKNNKMVANFITDEESDYFNSAVFQGILAKLQTAAGGGKLREKNNKLSLVFENIKTIKDAQKTIESLTY